MLAIREADQIDKKSVVDFMKNDIPELCAKGYTKEACSMVAPFKKAFLTVSYKHGRAKVCSCFSALNYSRKARTHGMLICSPTLSSRILITATGSMISTRISPRKKS